MTPQPKAPAEDDERHNRLMDAMFGTDEEIAAAPKVPVADEALAALSPAPSDDAKARTRVDSSPAASNPERPAGEQSLVEAHKVGSSEVVIFDFLEALDKAQPSLNLAAGFSRMAKGVDWGFIGAALSPAPGADREVLKCDLCSDTDHETKDHGKFYDTEREPNAR